MLYLVLIVLSIRVALGDITSEDNIEYKRNEIVLVGFRFPAFHSLYPQVMYMTIKRKYFHPHKRIHLDEADIRFQLIFHSIKCNKTMTVSHSGYKNHHTMVPESFSVLVPPPEEPGVIHSIDTTFLSIGQKIESHCLFLVQNNSYGAHMSSITLSGWWITCPINITESMMFEYALYDPSWKSSSPNRVQEENQSGSIQSDSYTPTDIQLLNDLTNKLFSHSVYYKITKNTPLCFPGQTKAESGFTKILRNEL
ncbi:hypothetical protein RF11_03564 [Thelohanellus kitauei]|uniref:Uncharacterized protein n=1 Tax=Thelohanellus kitauei TaxID=669202 RepID=A0A0C2MKW0_THEKT|nr:hypothetical protein RF11_03564 [Thelohanellus kitauei]